MTYTLNHPSAEPPNIPAFVPEHPRFRIVWPKPKPSLCGATQSTGIVGSHTLQTCTNALQWGASQDAERGCVQQMASPRVWGCIPLHRHLPLLALRTHFRALQKQKQGPHTHVLMVATCDETIQFWVSAAP